jgi:predicted nucleotide-binding protein (sugar kinase/HSP70/actin superfamily)
MANLLEKNPDLLFLPHIRGVTVDDDAEVSCTCPFVQGEPYYLRATFPAIADRVLLAPVLEFDRGFMENLDAFIEVARNLGAGPERARAALKAAVAEQEAMAADLREMGKKALAELEQDPSQIGVVLFGRPYNSFAQVANKGIPAKFSSRGIRIIPLDMLPFAEEDLPEEMNMYWAMGRMILKGARLVERHPQLFGTYLTNFSCGPDSFLITYFRDTMGTKPSLTLELDSHTAEAGIETRVEAFLDIVRYYRQRTEKETEKESGQGAYRQAVMEMRKGEAGVRTSGGLWLPLTDPRVKLVVPALGKFGTPLLAASLGRRGIRAEALPPADEAMLKLGRGNSSCKECLPLQTTLGSMLHYLKERPAGEVTAYFMATAQGPCRFGQYRFFAERTIANHRISDAAVLTLTPGNGYGGLGSRVTLAGWRAIVVGDLLDEIWATILAGAEDREEGLAILAREYQAIFGVIHLGWPVIAAQLKSSAVGLSRIRLHTPYGVLPKISLLGEIYVRHDPISLQNLIERLADQGFVVRTAQTSEWLKYTDWLVRNSITGERTLPWWARYWVKTYFDRQIRKLLAPSGLFHYEEKVEVEPLIEAGRRFVSPQLTCETILTVGAAMHEILNPSCGVISIGPFGCMPSRLAESILSEKFTSTEKKAALNGHDFPHGLRPLLDEERRFPFLAIETDGNIFPQIIEARLEAFCLQAHRLNGVMWLGEGRREKIDG